MSFSWMVFLGIMGVMVGIMALMIGTYLFFRFFGVVVALGIGIFIVCKGVPLLVGILVFIILAPISHIAVQHLFNEPPTDYTNLLNYMNHQPEFDEADSSIDDLIKRLK